MASPNPRQTQNQQVHYYRFVVNWNDTGIATGVKKGTLPAGSVVIGTDAMVTTAFNAGTNNFVSVGQITTATEIAAAASVAGASAGFKSNIVPNAAPFLVDLAADTDIYAIYVQSGTAATAGRAVIVVKYIPNNDL